jgi:putative helicase MOV10L1
MCMATSVGYSAETASNAATLPCRKAHPTARLLCCAPANFSADLLCSALAHAGVTRREMLRLNDPRRPLVQVRWDLNAAALS